MKTLLVLAILVGGGYYLWLQFVVSFGGRAPDMPLYAIFLIPLFAVMAAS